MVSALIAARPRLHVAAIDVDGEGVGETCFASAGRFSALALSGLSPDRTRIFQGCIAFGRWMVE